MANRQFYTVMKKIISIVFGGFCALISSVGFAQNVATQHNDLARTGWYPYETTLTTNNVNTNTFGFNFSHQTDDKIVGQPLVVLNVNIPNKGLKNVVFVTTLNNSVYAFDADVNADPYWQANYSNIVAPSPAPTCTSCRPSNSSEIHPDLCGGGYGDFNGNMGIIGTPVIDTLAGTMYFVTKITNPTEAGYDNHNWNPAVHFEEYTYPPSGFHQYLHAIDITTGADRPNSPIEITATTAGTGDGQTSAGIISFNPRGQFNRAGLVLSNGIVYIAFAAHCDNNPSHGWVIGYNATTLVQTKAYCATPNDGRGGIWMSGTAPAVDQSGNLYVTTGNSLIEDPGQQNINRINIYPSSVPSIPANRGEGVIKLNPDLTLSSYFTPYNYIALNDADDDFPTQVLLLPNTGLAVTGCKDGNLYVMNKSGLGGYNTTTNNNLQTVPINGGATMHSSFAYFGGTTPYFYQFSENTQLSAYPVTPTGLLSGSNVITNSTILGPSGYMGGFLSVSSNGTDPSTGILWAYQAENGCNANNTLCAGILHAVKASAINSQELWNSDMVPADKIKYFNKFSCPTIALGKVYIAASTNQLVCYGIKTNTSCVNNIALGNPVTVSSTGSGSAANVVDNNFSTDWESVTPPGGQNATGFIYIDLGNGSAKTFDICRIGITWADKHYAIAYNLEISSDGTNWTTLDQVTNNNTLYNEFNSVETGRYVRLDFVTNNFGNSYMIDEIQVFGSPASPCRAPAELAAAPLTANSEQITWDAVAGANYIVNYRRDISQEYLVRNVTTNSINLNALTCGNLYYYNVQSVCGGVPGGTSLGSFTPTGCPVTNCDLFPVRYFHLDVGDIGVAGSTCKNGDIYTLQGSGTDIGGNSDQFQFAYTYSNNLDYEAYGHLIQQDQLYPNNKLGIMVRDSLTSTSRFAFMGSLDNGANFIFEYRDVAGGPVTTKILPALYPTPWMKVIKTGTNYTGFTSPDNVTWTQASSSVDLHFGNDPGSNPNYGMAVTSANNTALSSGQIQQFTFDVSDITPLPVRLLNFTAKNINNDHVQISWSTSMEHLSDYFLVLKSTDNKTFQTMVKVNAVGESETIQNYSVNDGNPSTGTNYYRLKEYDKDGNFYLSPVVSVNFDAAVGFEIYPNPASDFTSINSYRNPIEEVKLFDITGKLLQDIHVANESKTVQLNVSDLSKGVYFVSVKTGSLLYRQKLVKQ